MPVMPTWEGFMVPCLEALSEDPESGIQPYVAGMATQLINDRGVFITTSTFSPGATGYAERNTNSRLILIDGNRLTDLMIRYGVGVQVKDTFHVVEVDEDFFE